MKSIFKYSYPFLFTTILAVLLQNLDRITLRAYFSLREVGLYALACKFGGLMQDLILEPYNRSFGAYRFTIMRSENARELLVKIYSYLVTGLAFAGLGITLYSKEVLRLMTEPAYWAAYPLIPLLVLSSIVSGSGYTFQTGLLYEKKTTYLIPISVASAAVNVVLYLVLIPRFGMFGAVYAVVTKGIIETALTYFVSQRFYSIPYDHLRTAKAVGVTVSLVLLVELLPDSSIVFSLAAKTMLVLSSIALYRLVGCLSRQDLDRARGFLSTFGRRFLPVGG
jgi:O-antigen/teichoic acid export membrane protein